jgi:hypothetical protein
MMSAMHGGKGDDKPNEENVPFVMRLGNEGLRIISKMRRINYMVRIHRSFAEWVRDWKSEKAKAREYPCNITHSISEKFCGSKVSTTHDCNELKKRSLLPAIQLLTCPSCSGPAPNGRTAADVIDAEDWIKRNARAH